MKQFLMVCLLLVGAAFPLASARAQRTADEVSPFVLADRFGEASARERTFFLFSTSVAKYILRHDGTGEATSRAGIRRSIYLKVGAGERIERVYSLEYQGELLLLYQAGDSGYLARMNQSSRKVRTVSVDADFMPPTIKDHRLIFSNGAVVTLN